MNAIDTTDRQIVDLLMEDGRMPSAEIARRIGGISERLVRYRIERLVRQGIIRMSAIPNPRTLGFSVMADVSIEVEPGDVLQVAHQLAGYECVSYVGCATGEHDVSVQIVARDNAELYTFVTEVVGNVPGVRKTTTSIIPIVLKDVYQWHIPTSACQPDRKREQSTDNSKEAILQAHPSL
jgi:Lrp/AsnC family transcriptional regulator for asnA, asnC and gidA